MNYHSMLRNIPEERRSRGLSIEDFIFYHGTEESMHTQTQVRNFRLHKVV